MFLNSREDGLGHIESNIVCLIILFYLSPLISLILTQLFVNNNKLKPYKFIQDRTLQPVLDNLSDLVTDELVQIEELEPLPIENVNFEHVEFEAINNYLTHGNIIGTYVPIHYHNDVLVKFNYVRDCNGQNNAINEKPIDVCTLEVYNPKSHVYS
jgi:hypothetical protein